MNRRWRCAACIPAYEGLRARRMPRGWRRGQAGETGLPFVDACMRYLTATGWLNFRMRGDADVGCDLSSLAGLARDRAHLARHVHRLRARHPLVADADAIGDDRHQHAADLQPGQAGADQDPTGAFTRRWVPELAGVPDAHLQTPWKWEGARASVGAALSRTRSSMWRPRRAARDAVWAVRQGRRALRREAARSMRNDTPAARTATGRVVNDRAPRRRAATARCADGGRLGLDL